MCLFATHYHEITQITELDPCIKNYSVSVLEENREILFQHRITRGSANKSYGIHVAKLAGIPRAVLKQANSILKELEETKTTVIGLDTKSKKLCVKGQQRSLFGNAAPETKEESPLQKKLKSVHPDSMSPMEALQVLYDLKDLASKE
jgi:DNA mismatch repair protein MutS